MYKYFPLKTVFLLAIAVFELGSLTCGVTPNSIALIIGRAITGIGASGVIDGCYTIIAFSVEPVKRPASTGILGATYGVASVVGPILEVYLQTKPVGDGTSIGGVSAGIILLLFKSPQGWV